MTKKTKIIRPKARLPKGFRDIRGDEIIAMDQMISRIRAVYEIYGFEPLETPALEYTDALGKFLPDQDRPNAGVFSLEDEDGQWMSLRYDLTAPLARFVAQNYDALPKPYRRYQTGSVFRNEKPGPGRFRQFTQFDADTVGTDSVAADAELCMLASETIEALGIDRGDYVIRINNRKILDGLLETIEIDPEDDAITEQKLAILRSLDKLDKFPLKEVALLLGEGRKDESGDFTEGAGLNDKQIKKLLEFVYGDLEHWTPVDQAAPPTDDEQIEWLEILKSNCFLNVKDMLRDWSEKLKDSPIGMEGIEELNEMQELCWAAGFGSRRIKPSASVVRGLDYYTGPVFEAELTFETKDDKGRPMRFGSVGGGGRYDGLVARFKGVKVPATGFSIGVSRLQAAVIALGNIDTKTQSGPVLVLVMDRDRLADYQTMAQELRASGIKAEMYLGTSGMRAQMKYADKREAPCVIIEGEDERGLDQVMIKDLVEGSKLSEKIEDNKEWREGRPAQFSVPRNELVEAVKKLISDQTDAADNSE